jgi:uncharacterized protein
MPANYDCSKCPAYCCSYDQIELKDRDINRLAKHLDLDRETFLNRYTKRGDELPVLRHQKDEIFGSVCVFLDKETRRCTVYNARPGVCHEYPDRPRCGYWDFLSWEREFQNDEESLPLSRLSWWPASS